MKFWRINFMLVIVISCCCYLLLNEKFSSLGFTKEKSGSPASVSQADSQADSSKSGTTSENNKSFQQEILEIQQIKNPYDRHKQFMKKLYFSDQIEESVETKKIPSNYDEEFLEARDFALDIIKIQSDGKHGYTYTTWTMNGPVIVTVPNQRLTSDAKFLREWFEKIVKESESGALEIP